jgi:tetratricopeptide (TPR) repeat protein
MERNTIKSGLCFYLLPALMLGYFFSLSAAAESGEVLPGPTSRPMVAVEKVVEEDIPSVNSKELRINYAVSEALTEAKAEGQLWYRHDGGQWRKGERFEAGQPIEFKADAEGVYEFAMDFGSEGAASTQPAGEASRFVCFVDYTKPLVHMEDVGYGNGKILVRWQAYDAHFGDRPIEIYLVKDKETVLLGRYANSGAAVVVVDPKMLPGKVKVLGVDRAGNSAWGESETVRAPVVEAKPVVVATRPVTSQPAEKEEPIIVLPKPDRPGRDGDVKAAMRDYKAGAEYRYRGQKELAIIHFKRSIDQAPDFLAGYVDLGGVLNELERYNESAHYFLQALGRDKKNVRAWKGLGIAKARSYQYQQAKYCLEKVVELDKKDVEGWLLLGDAYWTTGRKVDARLAWFKAQGLAEESGSGELSSAVAERIKLIKEQDKQDKR